MQRRNLIVFAIFGASVGASRTAHAAPPPVACPTATLLYYMTSVQKCYQGAVQMMDFEGMVSFFGGSAAGIDLDDYILVPLTAPDGIGTIWAGEVGFDLIPATRAAESTPFRVGLEFQMRGKLLGADYAGASYSTNPFAAVGTIDSVYALGQSVSASYGDSRGCNLDAVSTEGFFELTVDDGPQFFDIGRSGGSGTYSDGFFCKMIAPVKAEVELTLYEAAGVTANWKWDRATFSYEVLVTPEPATLPLTATGLLLLVAMGRRGKRRR